MAKANNESINEPLENVKDENASLADYSEHGSIWDLHKAQADKVMAVYLRAEKRFHSYARRIYDCSGVLRFQPLLDTKTGEYTLKLRDAYFCRVRHCPICQWRRALMWQAKFYQALPSIQEQYPTARWLFLTLTIRNCGVQELGSQLRGMGEAWLKLIKRKELSNVLGWIRTTEITKGKGDLAHPHYHILLLVKPSMLSGSGYILHARWTELWQQCAKLDYTPIVNIKAVKPKKGQSELDALGGAVAETLKYAVKPSDMVADKDWFVEMTKQVHKRRFIAAGGVLKDMLTVNVDDNVEPTINEQESDKCRLAFKWKPKGKKYKRFRRGDV